MNYTFDKERKSAIWKSRVPTILTIYRMKGIISDIYDSRNLYCDHFRIHGIILRTLKVKLSKYQSFNNSYICIDMGIYFATYDSQIVYNQQ